VEVERRYTTATWDATQTALVRDSDCSNKRVSGTSMKNWMNRKVHS
tara:strand:- start:250 stop:387 length:138 start_codon:yes stop_codon:yes gene_type:complete